jgi:hypothetical protein
MSLIAEYADVARTFVSTLFCDLGVLCGKNCVIFLSEADPMTE